MPTRAPLDVALVGGGLANGLLLWWLKTTGSGFRVRLFEAGPSLGGNHTWSFHGPDLTPAQHAVVAPLVSARWARHEVAFGSHRRSLDSEYLSVQSADFHARLMERASADIELNARVERLTDLNAAVVIDGRGPVSPGRCGWQKFVGLDLRLEAPHGLTQPLLMDATVPQRDGFRFFYALPWSDRRVLLEDTYYSDTPGLDVAALREGVLAEALRRGWKVAQVEREEQGALPIPLDAQAGVPLSLGMRGGFFHATTGYSLPFAARIAEQLSGAPLSTWADALARLSVSHQRSQRFFRMLNRLLFSSPAETRAQIFEKFYRHPEALISRFYAGQFTVVDQLKVLARGAGTVDFSRAVRAVRTGPGEVHP